jgi:hypothetical protein
VYAATALRDGLPSTIIDKIFHPSASFHPPSATMDTVAVAWVACAVAQGSVFHPLTISSLLIESARTFD